MRETYGFECNADDMGEYEIPTYDEAQEMWDVFDDSDEAFKQANGWKSATRIPCRRRWGSFSFNPNQKRTSKEYIALSNITE